MFSDVGKEEQRKHSSTCASFTFYSEERVQPNCQAECSCFPEGFVEMTFDRIHQLAWYMPRASATTLQATMDPQMQVVPGAMDLAHYLQQYVNPAFGWKFVNSMALSGRKLPTILDEDDDPIWRAYWHLRGYEDPVIRSVLQLSMFRETRNYAWELKGLLHIKREEDMPLEEHYHQAASAMSLPVPVVKCFEKLFYNIVDRHEDEKFIRSLVYPDTRLVELTEGYMQNVGAGDLMVRTAYNGTIDDLLFLAGASAHKFSDEREVTAYAEKLESAVMRNGLALAKLGFLNQRESVGINHSRQLLAAAKQGNAVPDELPSAMMGEILVSEARKIADAAFANTFEAE